MWVSTAAAFLLTLIGYVGCSRFQGHVDYQGCFNKVTLPRSSGHDMNHPFEADKCFTLCSGNGHDYVGLDSWNSKCYCGKDIMHRISKGVDSYCKPCKENSYLYCGGAFTISVYDIQSNTIANGQDIKSELESRFQEEPLILLAGQDGVLSYNPSTHDLHTLIKHEEIDALDYDLGRKLAFLISYNRIYRFTLFAEDSLDEKHRYVADVTRCPTFAVDWAHSIIYWPDCYSHHMTFINFTDEYFREEILIKPPEGAWAYAMAVDPYKGLLFWSSGPTLWSCRLDGRGLTKVIPSFNHVNRVASLSLDLTSERVYFSGLDKHDKNTSKLFYTSYSGVISHPLQFQNYEEGSRILSFGIFNHHIYFVKSVDRNSTMVMASKLEYNHIPTIILQDHNVKMLRLVHPKLQSPGKVDECTHHGCSHLCVVETALPHCYCPNYFELEDDNRTCFFNPGESEGVPLLVQIAVGLMLVMPALLGAVNPGESEGEPLLVQIAVGLMLVMLALLGAGILMCLSDKLWSQLHPNVVRLSVQRTLTVHRRPDGENLI